MPVKPATNKPTTTPSKPRSGGRVKVRLPSGNPLDPAKLVKPIRLGRIIQLLNNRKVGRGYYDTLEGKHLGSLQKIEECSGVSRTALKHALERFQDGVYTQPEIQTYERLCALINRLQPALVDPQDPEQTEIRFYPRMVGDGTALQGWQLLRLADEMAARSSGQLELEFAEEVGGGSMLSGCMSADEREMLDLYRGLPDGAKVEALDFIRSRSAPDFSGLSDRLQASSGVRFLVMLIKLGAASAGVGNDPDSVASWLISEEKNDPASWLNLDEKLLKDQLSMLLEQQEFPVAKVDGRMQYTYSPAIVLVARHCPDMDGNKFGGDVEALLQHCNLLAE